MSFSYLGQIPSSKSLMNRALITKSFFDDFKVIGESKAQDVQLMEAGIKRLRNAYEIQCGHAGTVLRFLAIRCSREVGQHILIGENRLFERPQEDLIKMLSQLSVTAEIKTLTPKKKALVLNSKGWHLQGNVLNLRVDKSSQFASAALLSSWSLSQKMYFRLNMSHIDSVPSYSYFEMTKSLLSLTGMDIQGTETEFSIEPGQKPKLKEYKVEPDMSSAFAVSALAAVDGQASLLNFPTESLQPDFIFLKTLKDMGVQVDMIANRLSVSKPVTPLKGVNVNLKNQPDLFPVLGALCGLAQGESDLRGASQLKHKESHRIKKVSELLTLIGREHKVYDDGVQILEGTPNIERPIDFDPDEDHRMAMAAGVLKAWGVPITIKNKEVLDKSFPEFKGFV